MVNIVAVFCLNEISQNTGILSMNPAFIVVKSVLIPSVSFLKKACQVYRLTARIDETLAPGVNASTAPYQCSYNLCMFFPPIVSALQINTLFTVKAHAAAVKGSYLSFTP